MVIRPGAPMFSRTDFRRPTHDETDDEDVLVDDYNEQIRYAQEGGGGAGSYDSYMNNRAAINHELQAAFQIAATPLDYQASLTTKFSSYQNFCHMFNLILNSDGPVDMDPPNHSWAWGVIDEFIYQFNSFMTYRQQTAFRGENQEEMALLRENITVWNCYSVLNVLYSFIQKSNISEQLRAIRRSEDPAHYAGEYGSRPLYHSLGYCSIIGLLRVHCLAGDFTLALKTMDNIELGKKSPFVRLMAAHFTSYYYVGFSYMMMGRYADAIKMFTHILNHVSRTRNFQKNTQFESISKKYEHMYALVAMCMALSPTRLDDTIVTTIREKYGEQFARMQAGGPESLGDFEKLFKLTCPKFISLHDPDFDNPAVNVDPTDHHCSIFLEDVKTNISAPILRSYLKLYTTVDLAKLETFLDVNSDRIRSWLLANKMNSRQIRWSEGGLLDGNEVNTSELDYALEKDVVHVSETKIGRQLVGWYLRNLIRSYN